MVLRLKARQAIDQPKLGGEITEYYHRPSPVLVGVVFNVRNGYRLRKILHTVFLLTIVSNDILGGETKRRTELSFCRALKTVIFSIFIDFLTPLREHSTQSHSRVIHVIRWLSLCQSDSSKSPIQFPRNSLCPPSSFWCRKKISGWTVLKWAILK